jgi:signal transduction histidine kinase
MKLSSRILAGILLPVALLVAATIYQLRLIQHLERENRQLVDVHLNARQLALSLHRDIARLDEFTRKFFVLKDPGYAGEMTRLRNEVLQRLGRLESLDLTPAESMELGRFRARWQRYSSRAHIAEQTLLEGGRVAISERVGLQEALGAAEDQLNRIDQALQAAVRAQIAQSARNASRARQISLLTALVSGLLAVLAALFIARSVIHSLRRLQTGTHAMAAGNFDHRVPIEGPAELASLARDFNTMAARIGELDELKSDFVSSVSHDLKAPLASMQETTRLMLEGSPGALNERQRRLLELSLQCNDRLSSMISDLLDLASLEAEAMQYDLAPHDLVDLVNQAVDEAAALGAADDIGIRFHPPAEPLAIMADAQWVTRALWNLLSNAVHFSPESTTIETSAVGLHSRQGLLGRHPEAPANVPLPAVVVSVRDHGPGISSEERETIFERFARSDGGRRRGQGTGLGLAITRQIVRQHGGEIWVETATGGGSLFVLALPLKEQPPAPEPKLS